jgi:geranylgeranyl transferase type-2 subunit alpha
MHGFSRKDYKERRRAPDVSTKALKLRTLESELLKRRRKSIVLSAKGSERRDDLDLTRNYLLVNPDPLWAWGYRRKLLFNSEAESDTLRVRSLMPKIEDELDFSSSCLLQNPKSYGAWLHRKWLCVGHQGGRDFWLREIERTSSLLSKDERNFHCWNFRRFLLSLLLGSCPPLKYALDSSVSQETRLLSLPSQILCGAPSAVGSSTDVQRILLLEWQFTTRKIQDNFSNFSAFHYRTSLLCEETREFLGSDWDLVENAVFTDPFE